MQAAAQQNGAPSIAAVPETVEGLKEVFASLSEDTQRQVQLQHAFSTCHASLHTLKVFSSQDADEITRALASLRKRSADARQPALGPGALQNKSRLYADISDRELLGIHTLQVAASGAGMIAGGISQEGSSRMAPLRDALVRCSLQHFVVDLYSTLREDDRHWRQQFRFNPLPALQAVADAISARPSLRSSLQTISFVAHTPLDVDQERTVERLYGYRQFSDGMATRLQVAGLAEFSHSAIQWGCVRRGTETKREMRVVYSRG